MDLLNSLKKYLPEIEQRMNVAEAGEDIKKIEKMIGMELLDSFKNMYSKYNGENNTHTGIILGFRWMDTKEILETLKMYKKYELTEINEDTALVPFAFDDSGCYFCVDMLPEENGTIGQVVALDCDYDRTTKISDSLQEFFEFIVKLLESGKFYLDTEKPDETFFDFDGGHFFNEMEDILSEYSKENKDNTLTDDEEIALPKVFWEKEFGGDKVSVKVLEKQKELRISEENLKISLAPITYMPKLQELIIHNCTITDFEAISSAAELKRIFLVNCTFDYEKLGELCKLTRLTKLTLRRMPITDISCLADIKSLKILRLMSLEKLDASQLKSFDKLQELELEDIKVENLDFLTGYKSLKVLLFSNISVQNLEFLQYLKKLKDFQFAGKAEDERGLRFLKELPQLTKFEYPVSDMEWYVGCEKLEQIGIDAVDLKNAEMLKDTNVSSITICNALNKKHAYDTVEVLKGYLKLKSYGMRGKFLRNN